MKSIDSPSSIELTSGDDLLNKSTMPRMDPTESTLSVTIAGTISFWEILKDLPSLHELTRQSITVKKINLDFDREATVGLISETQSISHSGIH